MKFTSVLLLFFYFASFSASAQRKTELSTFEMASRAYGYLYTQNKNLEKIKVDYPELTNNALYAEMLFKSSFGNVEKNVNAYFSGAFGETFKDTLNKYIESEMQDIDINVVTDFQSAQKFIDEVQLRSNGNIASPFLEIFLAFQFQDQPHNEFFEDYTYSYSTEGHEKSLGTKWKIDVPISWKAYEGDRPHVVQKFISHYGNGTEKSIATIALMVQDLPIIDGYQVTSKDMEDIIVEDSSHLLIPNGSEFISFKKFNIENSNGCILTFDYVGERMTINVKMRMQQVFLYVDNKLYSLIFTVSPKDSNQDLSIEFDKYQPLFTSITNSIVLLDKY